MTQKTKVLFIVPSLTRAGAETQVVDLVTQLQDEQFEKHVFTFERKLDQLFRINQSVVHFYNQPRRYKYDFSVAKTIAKIIDKEAIEIVHCTLQIALLMGWLGCRLAKRSPKLVVTLHTTVNRNKKDDFLNLLIYQWLMRSCDEIICVCKTQEQYWHQKFPFLKGRTRVIYNGIDPDIFSPVLFHAEGMSLRKELGISDEQMVYCCIAGFRSEKGHLYLLSAFKDVVEQIPTAKLLLAGDGAELKNVQQQAKLLGLEDNIYFLGKLSDVRPLLAASNVAIIASTAVETFSIAMLEAMSMEVPLVATDIGGTKEAVLHEKTGLIVSPGDAKALADALVNISINRDDLRVMSKNARKTILELYQMKVMIAETDKMLQAVSDIK